MCMLEMCEETKVPWISNKRHVISCKYEPNKATGNKVIQFFDIIDINLLEFAIVEICVYFVVIFNISYVTRTQKETAYWSLSTILIFILISETSKRIVYGSYALNFKIRQKETCTKNDFRCIKSRRVEMNMQMQRSKNKHWKFNLLDHT